MRQSVHRNDAARPAAIIDDDLLAECVAHWCREQAREEIGGAARRKWHDQAQRPLWNPLLRDNIAGGRDG